MRIIFAVLASISFLSLKAQTYVPVSHWDYTQLAPFPSYHQFININPTDHKWQLNKFAMLSAGYVFYGGGASFLTAPMGLQLTRPLNNNIYAFTGISVAPAVFSVNRLLAAPVTSPFYSGNNGYGFGVNGRVEAGLMYINDARTFSISGSVSVDRTSYPVYPSSRPVTRKP